ncbi:hypothetical protein SARC_07679 [Sphaeroforma arctica JP610]|uniref:Uncharacterized protein n=1 Tax=Sphaeroforma arctica JP610 TaxID=667725 RepID=A0A0L0FVH3_9EUKA|nr:hypothetical protein SARC_07679 [Sphaeroforma arctica JP610]KNC79943.1 hypothetical protein SARC_07679 [Sphaeroforma arctica JP610]|eukprot:XP_014153845.1 hypothetical protein SARC_07679 [Sphaeroforma arctica JP610]
MDTVKCQGQPRAAFNAAPEISFRGCTEELIVWEFEKQDSTSHPRLRIATGGKRPVSSGSNSVYSTELGGKADAWVKWKN